MMKQQINLYQEPFRIRQVVLPAQQLMWIEVCVLGLLAVISISWYVATSRNASTLAELQQQQQTLAQANQTLKEQLNRQGIDTALEETVADANRHLLARKKVLQWVAESQSENRVRFSALLEGPGRRHVQGLWLSGLQIADAGKALKLEGHVLDPRLVPEFLTALQQEPAYAGREFRKLLMAENEEQRGLRFELTTLPPGARVSDLTRPARRRE